MWQQCEVEGTEIQNTRCAVNAMSVTPSHAPNRECCKAGTAIIVCTFLYRSSLRGRQLRSGLIRGAAKRGIGNQEMQCTLLLAHEDHECRRRQVATCMQSGGNAAAWYRPRRVEHTPARAPNTCYHNVFVRGTVLLLIGCGRLMVWYEARLKQQCSQYSGPKAKHVVQ